MQITEAHLDEAIRMAKAGGGMGHEYNQRSWCGTACCVLGFARLVAGLPERNQGPQPGEIVDTPKGRLIEALMKSPDWAVLKLMERIQPDGTLDQPVHIDGNLDLGGCTSLTHLPDGLTVGGNLYLGGGCTSLTHLPDGLTVGGNLYLGGCTSLTHLPDGLTVGGNLYLGGCTSLTHLPAGLTVGGYLELGGCTKLTTLPDNLTVGGDIGLRGCTSLTHLPAGLTVGGYLELGGCTSLTHLPAGLTVGGRLYLSGCTALPDEKIPEHLRSKVVR